MSPCLRSAALALLLTATPFAQGQQPAAKSASPELAIMWADHASADGKRNSRALWALVDRKDEAVTFLHGHLDGQPRSAATRSERIARLLRELDGDDFDVRENASAELARMGIDAADALEKALASAGSAEAKKRIAQLIEQLPADRDTLPPGAIQLLRAVEVLEKIATPRARDLLRHLAGGPPDDRVARDARRALARLERRRGT
jgi:hypothetical protein